MLIKQLYLNNSARNFNYLIACPKTKECLAVDPLGSDLCLNTANQLGWKITQVVNTHEHWDHTGGNEAVIANTGATLLAHAKAPISGINRGLNAGDTIAIGETVTLQVLDTPGHTLSHICLFNEADPSLFCGDTLFNAGAGNCHSGGAPEALYETFTKQLARLPDKTRVYPGHEYLENNLGFSLSREPNNLVAKEIMDEVKTYRPAETDTFIVTTLQIEKKMNPFFRLDNEEIIAELRKQFPKLPDNPNPKAVFLALRELRNRW